MRRSPRPVRIARATRLADRMVGRHTRPSLDALTARILADLDVSTAYRG